MSSNLVFLTNIKYVDMPGMNITFNEDSENREVESATFKKIIQIVTSKRAIEHNFQAVFLFTYKYFSSDEFLLKKLIARFPLLSFFFSFLSF